MLSRTITRTTAMSAAATLLFLVGAPSAFATTSGADEHRNERAAANHDEHVASRTAGDDEPQPASNADFSGNGANDHGAYDSTRDGSPSGNGNGDGAATGQPCAGCVGNADNKNPPGQAPDGSDDNNGYECDGNSGVGRTNPAHTGCDVASDTPSTPATPVTPVLSSSNTPADSTTTAARETAVLGVSITRPPAEKDIFAREGGP